LATQDQAQRTAHAALIRDGKTTLGIEFGSTRIKASLIAPDGTPLASGSFGWENRLEDGVWTYHLDEVHAGLAACFASLVADVQARFGVALSTVAAMGVSGMMHGYVVLDEDNQQLVPFRTWRNNLNGQACAELTALLDFAMPQRWSVAHLYQSILEGQPHVPRIRYLTTLAGYVHWALTGEKVMGVGEASGMFPVDGLDWDADRMARFDALVAPRGFPWRLRDILPKVLTAGDAAGRLTPQGAKLLDPTGRLAPGIPFCPPEGDAGTGMVATNCVRPRTGNVSSAMITASSAIASSRASRAPASPAGRPCSEGVSVR